MKFRWTGCAIFLKFCLENNTYHFLIPLRVQAMCHLVTEPDHNSRQCQKKLRNYQPLLSVVWISLIVIEILGGHLSDISIANFKAILT
jgi:hypothetical protein